MSVKKEPLVFVGSLALVGLLVWPSLSADRGRRAARPKKPPSSCCTRFPMSRAHCPWSATSRAIERDLFSPPRDTRPLPPLELRGAAAAAADRAAPAARAAGRARAPSAGCCAPRHAPSPSPGLFVDGRARRRSSRTTAVATRKRSGRAARSKRCASLGDVGSRRPR